MTNSSILPDLLPFSILSPDAKVWIYQSDRPFSAAETGEINERLYAFIRQWASHGNALFANGALLYNRFLVLMVDEQQVGASGCSIDASVRFVRQLEQQFETGFFDRMNFAWLDGTEVRTAPRHIFKQLYADGIIGDETLVFDHLVQNKAMMEAAWLKPLQESWHKRFV